MTPEQQAHLHARWSSRTRSEWASAGVMGRLANQVGDATGDARLREALHQAAADEAHHGTLCAEVSARLGEVPDRAATLPGLPPAKSADPQLALIESVVFLLVTGEHIASALLGQLARTCREDLQRTIFRIAVDESRHAQLGWKVLDGLTAPLTVAQQAELRQVVPYSVGIGVQSFRQQLTSPWPELALQWGLADGALTERVAKETLTTFVLPELARRDLWPASRAA